MRFATCWWGVQILAETDSDKEILQKLYDSLPLKATELYEDGEMSIMKPEDGDPISGFTSEEIAAAKLAIQFNR